MILRWETIHTSLKENMSTQRKMCLIKDLKPYGDEWGLTLKLLHSYW